MFWKSEAAHKKIKKFQGLVPYHVPFLSLTRTLCMMGQNHNLICNYQNCTASTIYVPFHLCIKQNLFLFSNFLLHSLTKRQILQQKLQETGTNRLTSCLLTIYLIQWNQNIYLAALREAFF